MPENPDRRCRVCFRPIGEHGGLCPDCAFYVEMDETIRLRERLHLANLLAWKRLQEQTPDH
jgi:hypothetical protein